MTQAAQSSKGQEILTSPPERSSAAKDSGQPPPTVPKLASVASAAAPPVPLTQRVLDVAAQLARPACASSTCSTEPARGRVSSAPPRMATQRSAPPFDDDDVGASQATAFNWAPPGNSASISLAPVLWQRQQQIEHSVHQVLQRQEQLDRQQWEQQLLQWRELLQWHLPMAAPARSPTHQAAPSDRAMARPRSSHATKIAARPTCDY